MKSAPYYSNVRCAVGERTVELAWLPKPDQRWPAPELAFPGDMVLVLRSKRGETTRINGQTIAPNRCTFTFTIPSPGSWWADFYVVASDGTEWLFATVRADVYWKTASQWTQSVFTGDAFPPQWQKALEGGVSLGAGGGVTIAQVNAAIANALAGLPAGGVTIDEVNAAITDALNGIGAGVTIEQVNAAVQKLSDELNVLIGQVSDNSSALVETLGQQIAAELPKYVTAKNPTITGEAVFDGATIDALRMRLLDGSKGYVLRGYTAGGGTTPGLWIWDGSGKVVGRVATSADLADLATGDSSVTVHEDATIPEPPTFPPTPKQMIALWNTVGTGLHLYTKNGVSWLAQVSGGTEQVSVVVLSAGAITEAVFRATAAESLLVQHNDGVRTVVMTAPNGDAAFAVKHNIDLTKLATMDQVGAALGAAVAGGLTTEQVYQIIQAIPNTPVTAADLTAVQDQVQSLDDLYTQMLGTVAGWTQEFSKKADLTNAEQVITAKSVRADGVAFRELDFVLAIIDSPDFGERLALLRKDDSTDPNEANFVALRSDLQDLYDAINGMGDQVAEVRSASEAAGQIEAAETVQAVTSVTQMLTPGEWVDLTMIDGATSDPNNPAQMRLNAGRVELRGQFTAPTGTGNRRLFSITDPAYIPDRNHSQPMAAWEHAVDGRSGYCSVDLKGEGRFQPHGSSKWNGGNFGGIWWPAPGFTGPVGTTRPAPGV